MTLIKIKQQSVWSTDMESLPVVITAGDAWHAQALAASLAEPIQLLKYRIRRRTAIHHGWITVRVEKRHCAEKIRAAIRAVHFVIKVDKTDKRADFVARTRSSWETKRKHKTNDVVSTRFRRSIFACRVVRVRSVKYYRPAAHSSWTNIVTR